MKETIYWLFGGLELGTIVCYATTFSLLYIKRYQEKKVYEISMGAALMGELDKCKIQPLKIRPLWLI